MHRALDCRVRRIRIQVGGKAAPIVLAALAALPLQSLAAVPPGQAGGQSGPAASRADAPRHDVLALPLLFEANRGQVGPRADFVARGDGYRLQLDAGGATLRLARGPRVPGSARSGSAEVRMELCGADPRARAVASAPSTARVHYLRGSDPAGWTTDVAVHERVAYEDVFPGIDVVYYGRQRRLEYDFVVAPGAAPSSIALRFDGADALAIDGRGDLLVAVAGATLRFERPEVYQESEAGREPVLAAFVLAGEGRVRFAIGAYDLERALIIDPVLSYSTFLAGGNVVEPYDVAVDGAGHAYVAGYTMAWDYPTTPGAFDETCGTGAVECWDTDGFDAFVTKLAADGSSLVWSTFLGGSAGDIAQSVAVDSLGRVFLGGETHSIDFPVTADATQPTPGSSPYNQDAFVTVLTADGSALVFSTYLGGSGSENDTTDHSGIAVGGSGRVCVAGITQSGDFPTTSGALDTTLGGPRDVFAACYDLSGATPARTFATYLGGGDFEGFGGIALDSLGNVFVAGDTRSSDFPVSAGAYDTTLGGTSDAFLVKLDPSGGRLFSTLLGGSSTERADGVAVEAGGRAYLTGESASVGDFPTTAGALDRTSGGAYVTKLDGAGTGLVYSTFLAGTRTADVAVDGGGRASVVGRSVGAGFPVTPDAFAATLTGGVDVTFATLDPDGAALVYATYLGGYNPNYETDTARAVALDSGGSAYLVGFTNAGAWSAVPFPTTPGAFDREGGAYWWGFVTRIGGLGGTNQADLAIVQSDAPDPVGLYAPLTYTISVSNLGPDEANAIVVAETLPANVYVNSIAGAGWSCDEFVNPVICSRALLASGATAPDLTIEVVPFEAVGPFTATAAVSAHEDDPDPSNNLAAVESIVDAPDCEDGDGDGFVTCWGDCNPPSGLSCGDCGEYDPATYPGAPEICDFNDNDCDGEYDEGLGPVGTATLSIDDGARLWWSPVAGATAYDVVRGELGYLRLYGDYSTGSICMDDDLAAVERIDGSDPDAGVGYWYLLRAVDPAAGSCGAGTFESGGTSQYGSRDAWLFYGPCP